MTEVGLFATTFLANLTNSTQRLDLDVSLPNS